VHKHSISTVITTYNSVYHIEAAIDSIISQERVITEIIIVDDHSDDFDKLKELIERYKAIHNIIVLQPKTKGNANVSRNIGINNAKFEYVAFLDADDTWEPLHLISCINTINEKSLDGCFGKVNLISDKTITKSLIEYQPQSDICNFIFKKGGISVTSSLVIRKSALQSVTFDNNVFKHQDWDFLVRFTKNNKLGQSPYFGLNYTLSTGVNMSSKYNFDASIKFMNNTLPIIWHSIFISAQLSRIIENKQYSELLKLHNKLKKDYKYPLFKLGFKHNMIMQSSNNIVLFSLAVKIFTLKNKIIKITKRILN